MQKKLESLDNHENTFLINNIKPLSLNDQNSCESHVTEKELFDALNDFKANKSP